MSMFSRRHYVALAALMSPGEYPGEFKIDADDLAVLFKRDNPRFDRERFLDACEKAWPARLNSNAETGFSPHSVNGAIK